MKKASSQGAGMKEKKGRMVMISMYFTIIVAILGLSIISPLMPAQINMEERFSSHQGCFASCSDFPPLSPCH